MKKLVIIGASAMGRETCAYARECGMEVKGFLDSRSAILDGFVGYPPVLSSVEDYIPAADDVFVCAVGDPSAKLEFAAEIAGKGGAFVSVVHPGAYVGKNVEIGDGCIVCPQAVITNDTVLGNHVIVNVSSSISHDNRIGAGSTICPGCRLAGRVVVGRAVFLGAAATVIPDVALGDGVFVAAGAVVTRSFVSGRLIGVPAIAK